MLLPATVRHRNRDERGLAELCRSEKNTRQEGRRVRSPGGMFRESPPVKRTPCASGAPADVRRRAQLSTCVLSEAAR